MYLITLVIIISYVSHTEQFSFQQYNIKQCKEKSNGTTVNLEQIFIGRCHYFLNLQQISNCDIAPENYDCAKIYTSFKSAFGGKAPCDLQISDFATFLNLTYHPISPNSSVLWSGTYTPTHDRN